MEYSLKKFILTQLIILPRLMKDWVAIVICWLQGRETGVALDSMQIVTEQSIPGPRTVRGKK